MLSTLLETLLTHLRSSKIRDFYKLKVYFPFSLPLELKECNELHDYTVSNEVKASIIFSLLLLARGNAHLTSEFVL